MSNDYFKFKQFTVHQNRCAMKVGTDGTLLGAWATVPTGKCRLLDIGTGTGLIALMLAQRAPEAEIVGIDIDTEAVCQAHDNVKSSPFHDRIKIQLADAKDYHDHVKFDAIVCNPPYFSDSLECPDNQRTLARHTRSLTFHTLVASAYRLLSDKGTFSVIIPSDYYSKFISETVMARFFLLRKCAVKTTPQKMPKRYLIELSKQNIKEVDISEGIIETMPQIRSEWYHHLIHEFYIK